MGQYDGMTDAELEAAIAKAQSNSAPKAPSPYDGMSDEELEYEINRKKGVASPQVLQESHPDFSIQDRFVVKNFSNNPEDAASYLQARHPNLEISPEGNGNFKARKKGSEEPYRVLDPDTGFFSKDIGNDALDLVTDGITGGLSSAATAGAALLAAPFSAGAASLPAATVAGGASSAGLEYLKQRLGKALGVNKDVNGTDVAISGAAGAISPLLFGTGVGTKDLANKLISKGAEDSLGKAALAQRGVAKRIYDNTPLAPIGSAISGASEDALRTLAGKFDEFKDIVSKPGGRRAYLKETGEMVRSGFSDKKGELAKVVDDGFKAADESGKQVNLGSLISQIDSKIAEAEQKALDSGNSIDALEDVARLKEFKNQFFVDQSVDAPNNIQFVKPSAARDLERKLANEADLNNIPVASTGVQSKRLTGLTTGEREAKFLAGDLKQRLQNQLEGLTGSEAMAARKELGKAVNLEREVAPLLENPQTMFATLRNLDITSNMPRNDLLSEVDDLIGSNLIERSKMAQTLETFGPGRQSWFSSLKSPRSIPLAGLGALAGFSLANGESSGGMGSYVGGGVGALTGALIGSPAAMRSYIQAAVKAGRLNEALKELGINAGGIRLRSGGANLLTRPALESGVESAWQRMRD